VRPSIQRALALPLTRARRRATGRRRRPPPPCRRRRRARIVRGHSRRTYAYVDQAYGMSDAHRPSAPDDGFGLSGRATLGVAHRRQAERMVDRSTAAIAVLLSAGSAEPFSCAHLILLRLLRWPTVACTDATVASCPHKIDQRAIGPALPICARAPMTPPLHSQRQR